ncbi:MAG: hypothetical protein JNL75_02905 [Chitinophagales bacterium]|nr:hypothetical protein [Chitinophagales bacterium]
MKRNTILSILIIVINICLGQTKDANNYIIFYEESNTAMYFKMGNSAHLDYYLPDKVKFGEFEYYAKIRHYTWGKIDTTYYREDDENYYHYDHRINKESIVLPKKVTLGQKWLEADSSWCYEIIGIDKQLQTPARNYEDLIVIECIQLTGRDKLKSKEYHLHYANGIGLIGSETNGKLTSYLAEVKKSAKEGEKIGK